jgi:hypothetical protein
MSSWVPSLTDGPVLDLYECYFHKLEFAIQRIQPQLDRRELNETPPESIHELW